MKPLDTLFGGLCSMGYEGSSVSWLNAEIELKNERKKREENEQTTEGIQKKRMLMLYNTYYVCYV